MANGNSSAAKSARAKLQLRDSKGRWIEMGRSRVKWHSTEQGKTLAGTAMEVTMDGKNAVVHVTDENGVVSKHIVAGKGLTVINNKVVLGSKKQEPTNPKFYDKQAANLEPLELPSGFDEDTQKAFDTAVDVVSHYDKVAPGMKKTTPDSQGKEISYGDLLGTKKGPGFVVGVVPSTNSVVVSLPDGSTKTMKAHLVTLKDKGKITPQNQDETTPTTPKASKSATPTKKPTGTETPSWEMDISALDDADNGTLIRDKDGNELARKQNNAWVDSNGDFLATLDVQDIMDLHDKVYVEKHASDDDFENTPVESEEAPTEEPVEEAPVEEPAEPQLTPEQQDEPEEEAEEAPAEEETSEPDPALEKISETLEKIADALAPEDSEDNWEDAISVVHQGNKVVATMPDGSVVTKNNPLKKKFAVVSHAKLAGAEPWELRLADSEEGAQQQTGVTSAVFDKIKVMPIADPEAEPQQNETEAPSEAPETTEAPAGAPEPVSAPEPAPAPVETPKGKITAKNFVKETGEDEKGKWYKDVNGNKVHEGSKVSYNKTKANSYEATVEKVNKNNVVLNVPELGDSFIAQMHKTAAKDSTETAETPVDEPTTEEAPVTAPEPETAPEAAPEAPEEESEAPEQETPVEETEVEAETSNTIADGPINKDDLTAISLVNADEGTVIVSPSGEKYTKAALGWNKEDGTNLTGIKMKGAITGEDGEWTVNPEGADDEPAFPGTEEEQTVEEPETVPAGPVNKSAVKLTHINNAKPGAQFVGNSNGKTYTKNEDQSWTDDKGNKRLGIHVQHMVSKVAGDYEFFPEGAPTSNAIDLDAPTMDDPTDLPDWEKALLDDLDKSINILDEGTYEQNSKNVLAFINAPEGSQFVGPGGKTFTKGDFGWTDENGEPKGNAGVKALVNSDARGWEFHPEGAPQDSAPAEEPAQEEATSEAEETESATYPVDKSTMSPATLENAPVGTKLSATATGVNWTKGENDIWKSDSTSAEMESKYLANGLKHTDSDWTSSEPLNGEDTSAAPETETEPEATPEDEQTPQGYPIDKTKTVLDNLWNAPEGTVLSDTKGNKFVKVKGGWKDGNGYKIDSSTLAFKVVAGEDDWTSDTPLAQHQQQDEPETVEEAISVDKDSLVWSDLADAPEGLKLTGPNGEQFIKDDGFWNGDAYDVNSETMLNTINQSDGEWTSDQPLGGNEQTPAEETPVEETPVEETPAPEQTPAPKQTGKLTAKTFQKETGQDAQGKWYKDAEGNTVHEGDDVTYNKAKNKKYTAKVVKVNKNNVVLNVPELGDNFTAQMHKTVGQNFDTATAPKSAPGNTVGKAPADGTVLPNSEVGDEELYAAPTGSTISDDEGEYLFTKQEDGTWKDQNGFDMGDSEDMNGVILDLNNEADGELTFDFNLPYEQTTDEYDEGLANYNKKKKTPPAPEKLENFEKHANIDKFNKAPEGTTITPDDTGMYYTYTKLPDGTWAKDGNENDTMTDSQVATSISYATNNDFTYAEPDAITDDATTNDPYTPTDGQKVTKGGMNIEDFKAAPVGTKLQAGHSYTPSFEKVGENSWKDSNGETYADGEMKLGLAENHDYTYKTGNGTSSTPEASAPNAPFVDGATIPEGNHVEAVSKLPVGSELKHANPNAFYSFKKIGDNQWKNEYGTIEGDKFVGEYIGSGWSASNGGFSYKAPTSQDTPPLVDGKVFDPHHPDALDAIQNAPIGAKFTPENTDSFFIYEKIGPNKWSKDGGQYNDTDNESLHTSLINIDHHPFTYTGGDTPSDASVGDSTSNLMDGEYIDNYSPTLPQDVIDAPIGSILEPDDTNGYMTYEKTGPDTWTLDGGEFGEITNAKVAENLSLNGGQPYTFKAAQTNATGDSSGDDSYFADKQVLSPAEVTVNALDKMPVGSGLKIESDGAMSGFFYMIKAEDGKWSWVDKKTGKEGAYTYDVNAMYNAIKPSDMMGQNPGYQFHNDIGAVTLAEPANPASISKKSQWANGEVFEATDKTDNHEKVKNAVVGTVLEPEDTESNFTFTKTDDNQWTDEYGDYHSDAYVSSYLGMGFTSNTWTHTVPGAMPTPGSSTTSTGFGKKPTNLENMDAAPQGSILNYNGDWTKKDGGWVSSKTGSWWGSSELLDFIETADEESFITEPGYNAPAGTTAGAIPDVPTIDAKNWTKKSGAKGSNPGGIYEDENGDKHYVKQSKTENIAKNEVLADKLYQLAGIETSGLELADYGGDKLGTASKIMDGAANDFAEKLKDPEYKKKFQEGFAMDAWLGNWDVAGLSFDNVMTDANGVPVRVDPGGALLYRAQGTMKGAAFGDKVTELDTLRDPTTNPQTATAFSGMTDEQIVSSIEKVEAIKPEDIDKLVDAMNFDSATADEYKAKLKARRDDLIKQKKKYDKTPASTTNFGGADAAEYNEKGIGVKAPESNKVDNGIGYTEVEQKEDHPLFGKPEPVAPTPVPHQTFHLDKPIYNWEGKDEWLASVEKRFNENPYKNATSLQTSNNWSKIESILNGDETHLDYLETKKYLTPEMVTTAKTAIAKAKEEYKHSDAQLEMEKAKAEYEAKQAKYQTDLAKFQEDISAWTAVNGPDTQPAPKFEMPELSNQQLWEETEDWSKAAVGTMSAQDVLDKIKTDKAAANHGLSFAVDSDQIDGLQVKVVRIVGTDGEEKLRFDFKVTDPKGEDMEKMDGFTSKQGMAYNAVKKSSVTGLLHETGGQTYTDSSGKTFTKTMPDGTVVTFKRAVGNPSGAFLREQSSHHNHVTLETSVNADPLDFSKILDSLNIKATPSTEGDMRVLAENRLISAFGKSSAQSNAPIDKHQNPTGIKRKNQLKYIKETFGITPDDVISTTDGMGNLRTQISYAKAKELADRYKISQFHHNVSSQGSMEDTIVNMIAGDVAGLRTTRDRGMNGIAASGMSSSSDHRYGTGDGIYTSPKGTNGYSGQGVNIDAAKMLQNLDIWANKGDHFGRRKKGAKTPHNEMDDNHSSLHEVIASGGIPLEMWENVKLSASARNAVIQKLIARGIHSINGKSLNEFFLT